MRTVLLLLGVSCGALLTSCLTRQAPEGEESARFAAAAAAAESQLVWPEGIVAERGGFAPEGLEFDRHNSRFLMGSLKEGTVFQLERDGRVTPFVEDPELLASVGIEVDRARQRLLVVNADFSIFSAGGAGQAKLGVFDLTSGKRIAMVDLAPTLEDSGGETVFFANDVTVDERGTIYVSDMRSGAIYQVDETYAPALLHRFVPSRSFAPNGLVYHPSGYLLIAGGDSLYKLPLDRPAKARRVELEEPVSGADGVVWMSGGRLAIVADRAKRVVLLTSSDDWHSAELAGVARYQLSSTTAAVVDDQLYVVHPHISDEGLPSIERLTFH